MKHVPKMTIWICEYEIMFFGNGNKDLVAVHFMAASRWVDG